MPRATVDTTETFRKDLKSCEGGYVELRKMTYGQKLERLKMTGDMTVTPKRRQNSRKSDFQGTMTMAQDRVVQYEYRVCIVDHNLEDEHGQKLNFSNVNHINKLDPQIGEEISTYIDELNQFTGGDDDEEGNS